MKKNVYACGLFVLGLLGMQDLYAQRTVDLEIEVMNPLDGGIVYYNTPFSFTYKVKNLSGADIEATDTLRFYLTWDGNQVLFMDDNDPNGDLIDYSPKVNNVIAAGDEITLTHVFAIGNLTEEPDMESEFCLKILPSNSQNLIQDTYLPNNEFCYSIQIKNQEETGLEKFASEHIRMYPNPASTQLHLDVVPDGDILISTLEGRVVQSMAGTSDIDVSQMENGVYLISFKIKDRAISQRFIINR
ncbi:MAG: T9SS type A sorting domain-containing protein [Brumimicrobium sp.]|nr:T9SS type A sorting domain-containing protein [Brumimicrobium sp.]MCO5267915.1 T9SS type A sorting domain-containing protein [Brumimicrobium sp.]